MLVVDFSNKVKHSESIPVPHRRRKNVSRKHEFYEFTTKTFLKLFFFPGKLCFFFFSYRPNEINELFFFFSNPEYNFGYFKKTEIFIILGNEVLAELFVQIHRA